MIERIYCRGIESQSSNIARFNEGIHRFGSTLGPHYVMEVKVTTEYNI